MINEILFTKTNYEYIFNNSIVNIGKIIKYNSENESIFMMSYRYIKYNVPYHPWKVWTNMYITNLKKKIFNIDSGIITYNENCPILPHSIEMSSLAKHEIDDYDTTGICIFTLDKKEHITFLYDNKYIFDNYKHDARLHIINNDIIVTYNRYIIDSNNNLLYKMLSAKLNIKKTTNSYEIELSNEIDMFQNKKNWEKNCVYHDMNTILYGIHGKFQLIIENKIVHKQDIKIINDLIKYYGVNNIYFSLSTPPIRKINKNNIEEYIAVGHVKFRYKEIDFGNINLFNNSIYWNDIKRHGEYIYMMFIFVYDKNFNVTHLSYSFIPTDDSYSHLPYLLVFSSGLTQSNDEYIISYGEGDEKTKILKINHDNLNNMLIDINQLTVENYSFSLYNIVKNKFNKKKMNILILGYYGQYNCGDDGFYICFKEFFSDFKNINLDFYQPHQITLINQNKYDLIICGGGDIINDYFMKDIINIKKKHTCPMLAVSIGIPYTDCTNYLTHFDKIYVRNKNDALNMPQYNMKYYPDLCYKLPSFKKNVISQIANQNLDLKFDKSKFNIGVFLCRTFYNDKYPKYYENIIKSISNVLRYLANDDHHVIYLIPFCISKKPHEDDQLINNDIKKLTMDKNNIISLNFDNTDINYVKNMTL
jgi:hypothetical protein